MNENNSSAILPTDHYSRTLREKQDNPGALRAESTIHAADFYGNAETWNLITYRVGTRDTVFLQRNDAQGGSRLVLPPEVTAALARHRDQVVTKVRKRAARTGLETKRLKGIDPAAALKRHRRNKKGK